MYIMSLYIFMISHSFLYLVPDRGLLTRHIPLSVMSLHSGMMDHSFVSLSLQRSITVKNHSCVKLVPSYCKEYNSFM